MSSSPRSQCLSVQGGTTDPAPRRRASRAQWAVMSACLTGAKRYLAVRAGHKALVYNEQGQRVPPMEEGLQEDPDIGDFRRLFGHGWSWWSIDVGFIDAAARRRLLKEFNVDVWRLGEDSVLGSAPRVDEKK
jgi:hypothetical protein